MEAAGDAHTAAQPALSDIQSYLDTFNKEIDPAQITGREMMYVQTSVSDDNSPQVFVATTDNAGPAEQQVIMASAMDGSNEHHLYVASSEVDTQPGQQQVLYVAPENDEGISGSEMENQHVVLVTTDEQGNLQYTTADGADFFPDGEPHQQEHSTTTFQEEMMDKVLKQETDTASSSQSTENVQELVQINVPNSGSMILQQDGNAALEQEEPVPTLESASALDTEQVVNELQAGDNQVEPVETNQLIQIEGEREPDAMQMVTRLAEQAAGDNMILNSGSSYQTVTIVPSDSNPEEVSYVLIVSQPDDKDKDLSVYDFNDEGQQITQQLDSEGKKFIRVTPRKGKLAVGQAAHMCNYCNYTSPKRYLLARHMKSHSEERPHKCNICERGFKTVASLQNHLNTHTGTKPHQCKECTSAFTTSGELVRHVRYKHTHEKPHKCTECDYCSVELSKLKRHMRCHTGERPYQCPHCTYASPDTYKLKRHLRIHTGEKPYQCDICQARFTQSNSLKAHRLIHSGNKPVYQCELCPTTCGRKTDLRIHIQKLHTSDQPIKCKRCEKEFVDRYTYKLHVKTHDGEKCFKCDLCPYASLTQRHLESHMLIHTDQKPFQCGHCDQTFRQKQLLKRHQNLYHNPDYVPPPPREKTHECPECHKMFRHKGNLIRHLAIHDPEAEQQVHYPAEDMEGEESVDEETFQGAVQLVESEHIALGDADYDLDATADFQNASDIGVAVTEVVQHVTESNRRRGRPRVMKFEEPVEDDEEEEEEAYEAEIDEEGRLISMKRRSRYDHDEDYNPTPNKQLRRSGLPSQERIPIDPVAEATKVALQVQKKAVQKQKEIEEAFGFDADEQENEDEETQTTQYLQIQDPDSGQPQLIQVVASGDSEEPTIVQLTEEQMAQLAAQVDSDDQTVQVVLQQDEPIQEMESQSIIEVPVVIMDQ